MKFKEEFKYSFIGVVIVIIVFLLFSFSNNLRLQIIASFLSIVLGSSFVILGFWGADFAFALASGHLDQSKTKGKFKGEKKKVYVPFMKNYTPLEWWNINWFITFIGVILVALGSLILGIIFGVHIF